MKLFRNADYRFEAALYLAGSAVLTAIGFFLVGRTAGLIVGIACLFFLILHALLTSRRYKQTAELSRCLDRILHGRESVLIGDEKEGELSILKSEIGKMTVRLKEQNERLAREKRRLTDVTADLFHQMRTPMTAMNLIVTMLNDDDLPFERRLSLVRDLKKQLERTEWLIEALLKMAKLDASVVDFRKEPVPVSELLYRSLDPFRIPMEVRGQELVLTVKDESFIGDPVWSVEAIGNLIRNAVEHTPEGGRIVLTASENPLFTEILVEDDGDGFAPDDLPHLFERFYRGKNASAGSVGIGLAMAREIVAEQNGTIAAANRPEGGARFTVRFYKNVI